MSASLLAAEWTKTRRRPMHRLLLWLMLGLVFAAAFLIALSVWADPSGRERLGDLLPFPLVVVRLHALAEALAPFVVCLITASVVGGEYAQDTWKMILPRRPGRGAFLLVKALCAWAFSLLVLGAFLGTGAALGSLTAHLCHFPLSQAALDATFPAASLLCLVLHVTVLVGVTTLLTVATRSMTAGAGAALVWSVMGSAVARKERHLALLLPDVHLENLGALWSHDGAMLDRVQSAFEAEISAGQSLWVLGAYAAVGLSLAVWIFSRRDQSGMPGA
jgi:ABC-type transport system involved in multi-copper enzyme maturation permease subunit